MNLTNNFQIDRIVKTKKTELELIGSIKKFNHKKIDIRSGIIMIYGNVCYDFVCELNALEVKLISKPKSKILIAVLIFLIIWTVGFTYEHGIFIGIPTAILFVIFFGFVNKRMMELSLDEITELIKKK